MKSIKKDFVSKFHLLNSQENSEEIIWSSDSSDYETSYKENNIKKCDNITNRKRKRVSKKHFNFSNLDISFTEFQDVAKGPKRNANCKNNAVSPIISSRNIKKTVASSPILPLKRASPQIKVKKKLFPTHQEHNDLQSLSEGCNAFTKSNRTLKEYNTYNTGDLSRDKLLQTNEYQLFQTSDKLKDKVKSYFDSHFSSGSTQHSISECETESTASNELEITSSITQVMPIKLELKSSSDSLTSLYSKEAKSKKVKYKKGGLSHRLNALIKKQNSSLSLWHHEKFLAVNSNFVIPREDVFVYRIKNVTCKYGLTLLHAAYDDDVNYLILINNLYIKNNLLERNFIFKLYRPFREICFDKYKVLVNVCKFDCTGVGS